MSLTKSRQWPEISARLDNAADLDYRHEREQEREAFERHSDEVAAKEDLANSLSEDAPPEFYWPETKPETQQKAA